MPATTVRVEKRYILRILSVGLWSYVSSMQWACTISSVFCPAVQCLSTLSYEPHDFREKVTEHKICVLFFSITFVWKFSHSKKWARYDKKMYAGLHVKYLLFMSDFNKTWIFSIDFRKILKYQISWKSFRWEPSCSERTDRHDEANRHFSQFCERAKIF